MNAFSNSDARFLSSGRFTSWQAFRDVLKEIGDLAGQRELVAENLQGQVTQSISLLSKTLREDRKKCLGDGALLSQNLSAQIGSLDRAKRQYEKAFREAEKAVDAFQKADADLNLSRADVSGQGGIVCGRLIICCPFAGGEAQADNDDQVPTVGRCEERVREPAAEDEQAAAVALRVLFAGGGESVPGDRREAHKGLEGVHQGHGGWGVVSGTDCGALLGGDREGVRVHQREGGLAHSDREVQNWIFASARLRVRGPVQGRLGVIHVLVAEQPEQQPPHAEGNDRCEQVEEARGHLWHIQQQQGKDEGWTWGRAVYWFWD